MFTDQISKEKILFLTFLPKFNHYRLYRAIVLENINGILGKPEIKIFLLPNFLSLLL